MIEHDRRPSRFVNTTRWIKRTTRRAVKPAVLVTAGAAIILGFENRDPIVDAVDGSPETSTGIVIDRGFNVPKSVSDGTKTETLDSGIWVDVDFCKVDVEGDTSCNRERVNLIEDDFSQGRAKINPARNAITLETSLRGKPRTTTTVFDKR